MLIKKLKDFNFSKRFTHKWIKPDGYDTGIKVYNCIAKEKVPLIIKNKQLLTWYTCGPTVYDSSHLGHASSYVKLDIIQRIIKNYFKINLITVMNITDIDDKIIQSSKEKKIPFKQLAENYEEEFWQDLHALNVNKPHLVLRVTDHIDLIQKFIEVLINKNQAYVSEDGSVYYNVSTYNNYGKLQNIGDNHENVKVNDVYKKSPQDFVLWKASKPDEPFWKSKWGQGRPGWHIECSALAANTLGSSIDIHAGGIDLRFPHHENEEAQSCAYFSQEQWVSYWLHTGHLHTTDNIKMSKSLKNTISIQKLLTKYNADIFRMLCLMSHYSSNINYNYILMETAENNLKAVKNFLGNCNAFLKGHQQGNLDLNETIKLLISINDEINNALIDDFNTPAILKSISNLITQTNKMLYNSTKTIQNDNVNLVPIILIKNFVTDTFKLFGICVDVDVSNENFDDYSTIVNILNEFRQNVRSLGIEIKNKTLLNYCDEVRDNVKKCGIVINDYGKKSNWLKQ